MVYGIGIDVEIFHVSQKNFTLCPGVKKNFLPVGFYEAGKSPVRDQVYVKTGIIVNNGYFKIVSGHFCYSPQILMVVTIAGELCWHVLLVTTEIATVSTVEVSSIEIKKIVEVKIAVQRSEIIKIEVHVVEVEIISRIYI